MWCRFRWTGTISRAISRPSINRSRRRRANSSAPPRAWTTLRNPSRARRRSFPPCSRNCRCSRKPSRNTSARWKRRTRSWKTHIPGRASSRTRWIRPNRRTLPSNLRSPPPPGNMSSTPARWANRIPRPSLPRPIWTRCRRNTRSPPPRSKNWKASSPPTPRRCRTTRTP